MPENVGVDELIADQLGAGEGMVSKAEEGVGRISCSASSHNHNNTTTLCGILSNY